MRGTKVGVYGLDYVMTVRDYSALVGAGEIVSWDLQFDHARAVKSERELDSVRDSVRINTEGFWIFLEHFAPGKTEREILAHAEKHFVEAGCGRLTMDMGLGGDEGAGLLDRGHPAHHDRRRSIGMLAQALVGQALACF